MMNIDLSMTIGIGYDEAETAARKAVSDADGEYTLTAWYDKARKMGAPQEACSLESWKCVRDYAEHHDADVRISVNGDAYEFYFTRVPHDTAALDRDGIEGIHAGIAKDEFDNVQGG